MLKSSVSTTKRQKVDNPNRNKLGSFAVVNPIIISLGVLLFTIMSPCIYAKCAFTTPSSAAFLLLRKQSSSFHPGSLLFRREPCRKISTHRFVVENEASTGEDNNQKAIIEEDPPVYLSQGLFAIEKPIEWTSQDVVSYVRGMLTRDARDRGAVGNKRTTAKRKKNLKVGHGGTLDPLATGVLVIGVGSGTKELQGFLSGNKKYKAEVELGFETTTLDMEGNITKTASFDHVTQLSVEAVIPQFIGNISQIPPIFSAIKRKGKKMYEEAREGKTAEELAIPPRNVLIHDVQLLLTNDKGQGLPQHFGLDVECGGGTYIRSLVRDIGTSLDTFATMTNLERTQQGPFTLQDALPRDQWSVENIYAAIQKNNDARE
mmetsp:Transcript_17493/g.16952  ORF Transcript_17493/g.16952 Transcript_17493/m.16952 type:complete len:374 (-) Transcript_17493:108-1229(-)